VYPALDIILRVNLGGFSSSEYVGYHFYDPTFNFEKSILQLNDPKNDLSATLQVTNTDSQIILEGPVTHRLTNSKGKMRLVMELEDAPAAPPHSAPFLSVLKGEYQGNCGKDLASLQIETARGLGANTPGNALSDYSITGRLGFSNGPLCYPDKNNKFCSLYPFSTGTYSPFTGRLKLQGPLGTMDCSKSNEVLECMAFGYEKSGACTLRKSSEKPTDPAQIPASIFLTTSPAQMAPLPLPLPPDNKNLVNALNGDFYGFLHFENRDEYQLMEMSLVASTSTENPHIQNQVMVEPTILLRLGNSWDSTPATSLFFPQRVFWLSTGFTFQSDSNDYFVVIGNWRTGYVGGVLYSRSFGRVGTFEMQKGTRPEVAIGMATLANPAGQFSGPKDSKRTPKDQWILSVEIPNQAPDHQSSGIPLLGRYSGPGQLTNFASASLDMNSGFMGFLAKKPKGDLLVTGQMLPDGKLKLLWPTGPALGAPMVDYEPFTYWPVNNLRSGL
jgi:hypothetical protein